MWNHTIEELNEYMTFMNEDAKTDKSPSLSVDEVLGGRGAMTI